MIGFDIGGTKCAVSVGYEVDGALHIEKKEVIPTDLTASPYVMIERMCTIAERLTDDMSLIGISCGGPLNSRQGAILSPPNLPGWDNVEIVDLKKNGIMEKSDCRMMPMPVPWLNGNTVQEKALKT